MAAIIGNAIGKIHSAICTIACIPCKLCGSVCPKACGLYYSFVLATGIPPIVFTIQALVKDGGKCIKNSTVDKWLYVNGALCIMNICATFYIGHEVFKPTSPPESLPPPLMQQQQQKPENNGITGGDNIPVAEVVLVDDEEVPKYTGSNNDEAENTTTEIPISSAPPASLVQPEESQQTAELSQEDPPNASRGKSTPPYSNGRVRNVLCYDSLVALYMIGIVIFFVWQIIGIYIDDPICFEESSNRKGYSMLCGFVFITFGGCCLCISPRCASIRS